VIVRCMVSADGYVDDLKVVKGDEPFVTFVLKAVKRWRYDPALNKGQAIPVGHQIEVRFNVV
jgi:TonB family protein